MPLPRVRAGTWSGGRSPLSGPSASGALPTVRRASSAPNLAGAAAPPPGGGAVTPGAMIPVQSLTLYTSSAAATRYVKWSIDSAAKPDKAILLECVLTDNPDFPCKGTVKTTPPEAVSVAYAETLIVASSGEVIGRDSACGGATVGDRVTVHTGSAKILRLIQKAADRGGTSLESILDDAPGTPADHVVSLQPTNGTEIPVLTRGAYLLGDGPLYPPQTITVYVRSSWGRDALMERVRGAASGRPLKVSDLLAENPGASRRDQVTLEAPRRGFAVTLVTQVGYVLGLADNQPLLGQRQHFLRD